MAQEGAIVQIKHCLILKYEKNVTKCFSSVIFLLRKIVISIEMTPIYKAINMYLLLLPFESLVLFSFSISPILFCSQVIGDEFCFPLLLQVTNFCKITSVFAFQIEEWF